MTSRPDTPDATQMFRVSCESYWSALKSSTDMATKLREILNAPDCCSGDDEPLGDPYEDALFMLESANSLLELPGPTADAELMLSGCVKTLMETVPQQPKSTQSKRAQPKSIEEQLRDDAKIVLSRAQVLLGRLVEWRAPMRALTCFESAVRADGQYPEAHLQLARSKWKRASTAAEMSQVENLLRGALALCKKSGCDDDEARETEMEASKLLARFLCQSPNRQTEAHELLGSIGFKYALRHSISSSVFSVDGPAAQSTASSHAVDPAERRVLCFDNVLPPCMLEHMHSAFALGAPFWREHAYDSPQTGFFSFQHAVPDEKAVDAAGTLHSAILHIWRTVCQVNERMKKARFAEWWAHSRPHCNGHTLHYDYIVRPKESSGKKRGPPGMEPRHPIMSTVTFVTADCGGPTLVTDQTMDVESTHAGWLVAPKLNRTICFDGQQLHCVLPGSGAAPSPDARRITFMIAFWEEDPRAPWFPLLKQALAEKSSSKSAAPKEWPISLSQPNVTCACTVAQHAKLGSANVAAVHAVDQVLEPLKVAKGRKASANVDMLGDDVFCFFGALSANLQRAQSGVCSLNCGGQCDECKQAATERKSTSHSGKRFKK
jgi:hypothetical protein